MSELKAAWKVLHEEPSHFSISTPRGLIKVHKSHLTPEGRESFRRLTRGGKVQKLNGDTDGNVVTAPADNATIGPADPTNVIQGPTKPPALTDDLRKLVDRS
jgi:hypothetical protein